MSISFEASAPASFAPDPSLQYRSPAPTTEELSLVGLPLARPPRHANRVSVDESWQRPYVIAVLALDTIAIGLAILLAVQVRFGDAPTDYLGVPYGLLGLLASPVWLTIIALKRGYDPRFFGLGVEEFRRVGNASLRLTAIVAVLAVAFQLDVARSVVGIGLPLAIALTLLFRYGARKVLQRSRANGLALHRVLVVGDTPAALALATRLRENPRAGYQVVGLFSQLPEHRARPAQIDLTGGSVPVIDSTNDVRAAMDRLNADTVAVAQGPGVTPDALRRIAWQLEGSGAHLLVAPALTDVAGPRIHVRPVSGLPLLQVAEPEFDGPRRLLKSALDVTGAVTLLVLFSPVFLVLAVMVGLTTPGPVFFRQTRVGRDGKHFRMVKFRSMYEDAEDRRAELEALNKHGEGHVLFKMDDDPRVTKVGRFLRRTSLDELPQLFNVLRGEMSLVGPRPPLPSEVAEYEDDVHRRLLVKPGMTGLWQVSGRADLSWEESVRLDLYYVENWSVALDIEILWKTAFAVAARSGAH